MFFEQFIKNGCLLEKGIYINLLLETVTYTPTKLLQKQLPA